MTDLKYKSQEHVKLSDISLCISHASSVRW